MRVSSLCGFKHQKALGKVPVVPVVVSLILLRKQLPWEPDCVHLHQVLSPALAG